MKFNQTLSDIVRATIETGSIPMLLGEPGIGKSSWLIDLGQQMGTKVFVLACNQLADKADLTGARLVPDEANPGEYKQAFFPHQVIADAITYATENPRETPLLFMDEINRTTPDVTSAALSIPTLRSIGSRKLPDNLRVVIAGNDKGNVTTLDDASISRFVLLSVTPDVHTFLTLDPELNIWIKNVLTKHPNAIFGKSETLIIEGDDDEPEFIDDYLDEGEEMNQLTTPRTISALSRFLNKCTHEQLLQYIGDTRTTPDGEISILQDIIQGYVGTTNFSAQLLVEILNGVTSQTNHQVNVMQVVKPTIYDEMKAQSTLDDLANFIENNMTDKEKAESVIYALYEKEDNEAYLQTLSSLINKLPDFALKTLMQLSATDKLDKQNVQAFLQTNTQLANTLAIILES